jgi:polyhydroxyalkanoate synthesis regulator phasin
VAKKEKDSFQRYLDAGIAFTNLTRARAEELVQDLIQGGELQGKDAKERVEDLLERSRRGRAAFVDQVRREVHHQLEGLGITSLEELAHQVAELLNHTAETGRKAAKKATGKKSAAKKANGKKTTSKAGGSKKSPVKKAGTTKSAARKAGTKKAAAKKQTANKPAARPISASGSRVDVASGSDQTADRGTD